MSRLLAASLACLTLALAAGPAPAADDGTGEEETAQQEPVTLDRLSDYLNSLTVILARFTQVNSDGTLSRGTLAIRRPWRARLEYDPPDPGLVVAGAKRIAFIDRKSNSQPNIFPLKRTPLYLLLKENINPGDPDLRARLVTGADYSELHMQSPSKSYKGQLVLSFVNNPLQLDGWTFVDELGNRTHVSLDSITAGVVLSDSLFDIELELANQERNR